MKTFIVGSICLLLSTSALFGYGDAQGGNPSEPSFLKHWDSIRSELRLSRKQESKLYKINAKYEKKYVRYTRKIEPIRKKLHAEVLKPKPRFARTRLLLEKLYAQKTNRKVDQLKHRTKIVRVLNKGQRNTFFELIRKHEDKPGHVEVKTPPRKALHHPPKAPAKSKKKAMKKHRRKKLKKELKQELKAERAAEEATN